MNAYAAANLTFLKNLYTVNFIKNEFCSRMLFN